MRTVNLFILVLIGIASTQCSTNTAIDTPYHVELNVNELGIHVSPTLYGAFFEDLNYSLDGGIAAQLVQNSTFESFNLSDKIENIEYPREGDNPNDPEKNIYGWTPIAKGGAVGVCRLVSDRETMMMNKNSRYCVRYTIRNAGTGDLHGYGIAANGWGITPYGGRPGNNYYSLNTQSPSMPIDGNTSYNLTLYLRGASYSGNVKVFLEDDKGNINSNLIEFRITDQWQKYTGALKALRKEDCRMAIVGDAVGTFYLDYVTLIPEASVLWKNGAAGGLRKDLMEALEKLNPKFLRFPGGCASEGASKDRMLFWKETVGPREERIGSMNFWGYWATHHIGFYEYFCMAEQLNAEPIPVILSGVSSLAKGSTYYVAPINTPEDIQAFKDLYVKDALDLIEFCNGDVSTEWGAKRAAMGHPEPFNLKYLALGNEQSGDRYWDRFDIIYNAVTAKYPNIKMITMGSYRSAGSDFDDNYRRVDSKYPNTIVDEHYYQRAEWFLTNTHRYNPDAVRGREGHTYDRSKPTRVFIGEYATSNSNNTMWAAVVEAAYGTSVERNSDMVVLTAYAPLYCKAGYNKWNTNLIWFDNRGLWRSTSYYYQKLFFNNVGDRILGDTPILNIATNTADTTLFTSPTINSGTGEIFYKVVNTDSIAKQTTITLNGAKRITYQATMEYITAEDKNVKNQKQYPATTELTANTNLKQGTLSYDEAVTPQTLELGTVSRAFEVTFPMYSVCVIKLKPVKK